MRKVKLAVIFIVFVWILWGVPVFAAEEGSVLVFALDTQKMFVSNQQLEIETAPFLYGGKSYMPLRKTIELLGGDIHFDDTSRIIKASYGPYTYQVSLDDEKLKVYQGFSYIPVREMGETFHISIEWHDGLVVAANQPVNLSEEDVAMYKTALGYDNFIDRKEEEERRRPRYVVNPYQVYSYEQMNADLTLLTEIYPDLFSVFSIGTSVEGRELTAFHFGKGDKKIILVGSQHAREYISTTFIMYMVDRYAYGYATNGASDGYTYRKALEDVTFVVLPMMNPDGVNLVQNGVNATKNPQAVMQFPINDSAKYGYRSWKANINGVDLNNNFPVLWQAEGVASSSGYHGPYANSEPETQAVVNLINETDFAMLVSFHTQGQMIYWMEDNTAAQLADIQSPYVTRIANEIGFTKMAIQKQWGTGGYMTDYVRYYKGKLAMTVELCPYVGPYPYPESKFDTVAWPVRNIGLILADTAMSL